MQKSLRFSGGAIIGRIRVSTPIDLFFNSEEITLSGFPIGTYNFHQSQVISIDTKGNSRIVIHHNEPHYPERIIFITSCAQEKVKQIHSAGFYPSLEPHSTKYLRRRGWPIRWQFILFALIWWNGLLFLSYKYPKLNTFIPLPIMATLSIFTGCTLILSSSRLQNFILESGRDIGEIRLILILGSCLTGLLSLVMMLTLLLNRLQGYSGSQSG